MADRAPTMLLLHGGRHGGWCWDRMVPLLQAAGYRTVAPTYTGLGERRHLLSRDVDLSMHLEDVRLTVEHRDVRDAVVVAHSYGGMVATGLVDRMPERFRHVVYLDALVPPDGASVMDLIPPEYVSSMHAGVASGGDGWRVPATAAMLEQYGVHDPDDLAWALPRVADQPFATYTEPLSLTGRGEVVPRSFVWFSRSTVVPAAEAHARRDDDRWGYAELAVDHDAIITDPVAVTGAVRSLVGTP